MKFTDYQAATHATAIYPKDRALEYLALGLAGEAGEVAGKVSKVLRDGHYDPVALAAELGDVLWYLAQLASTLDADLADIAAANLAKLQARLQKGTLGGSGDNR